LRRLFLSVFVNHDFSLLDALDRAPSDTFHRNLFEAQKFQQPALPVDKFARRARLMRDAVLGFTFATHVEDAPEPLAVLRDDFTEK